MRCTFDSGYSNWTDVIYPITLGAFWAITTSLETSYTGMGTCDKLFIQYPATNKVTAMFDANLRNRSFLIIGEI